MPLDTNLIPYEFLARWDEAGALQGCHVIFMEVKSFQGEVLSTQMGQALTPDQAAALGFPFADVLSQMQADALARVATLEAEITQTEAALQAARTEAATLQRENEGLRLDLEAARAAYTPPSEA